MSEKKIEQQVAQVARAHGWYTRKFSSPSHRGVPDRIFIKEGRVVFIEFKAPGKAPTALQRDELEQITQHGIEAYWADSAQLAKDFLGIPT